MGFIAQFRLSSPLLKETLQAVPDVTLEMEDLQLLEGEPAKYIFWASGADTEELEAGLLRDSTVEEFVCLTGIRDRQLYRVTFTERARERLAYPTASKFDIVYLNLVRTNRGSQVRAQVPSRDALRAYREACEARDIPFKLERLYEEESWNSYTRYNLTERQYEALVLAYEAGYFGTNREADLGEIAAELDISRQALAGRLRRGFERLIENTLA